ncbi:bifunctional glycosyltransferase/CDP-glycerol:glycerophosphate glycerophosphotransferase [Halalkalibacter alkalisediminis]|uniref:CDP-glycerol glycerophosphotransferase family protein n=1 Tax=Halalkalibacter alkalisediminis TaxID=935616 RepID=A0ABV6NET6_9BACI|nr:bifunctional glycosyltransferase family 2 protein/CDP-glycerol:glycerophosphate glycerophosphotransferase [Halalkalibacter alkalisediminis]
MSKVSVIIPVYNKEEYLERCLESLLNQTYTNFEAIIINDSSSDDSEEMIEKFANRNSKLNVYNFEENKGAAAARNFGVSQATGDFLYFLDADDHIAPYTLEVFVNHIGEHPLLVGPISKATTVIQDHYLVDDEDSEDDQETEESNDTQINVYQYRGAKKKKALRRKAIVNILWNHDFVKQHQLTFDEHLTYYSDLSFTLGAIGVVESVAAIRVPTYIRGECYDPIDHPSLRQNPISAKIPDFLMAYQRLKEQFGKCDGHIDKYLDKDFLRFYHRSITNTIIKDEEYLSIWFEELRKSAQLVDPKTRRNSGFFTSREMKTLLEDDESKLLKKIRIRHQYKRVRTAFSGRQALYKELYRSVFLKRPLKEERIIFESFAGKSYSDNPRAIYEEMLQDDNSYEYIWIMNDPSKRIPGNAKKVKRLSLRYFYFLATSKYWVINARMPGYMTKRPETVYLQTWHGTPLKKLAHDMKEVRMPGTTTEKYKKNFYLEAQKWDYLVSPNDYSTEIFKRAFKFHKTMLDVGYPRNDVLYKKNNEENIAQIKKKIGLPNDKKVILYAPTWRDDEFYKKGQYKFDLKLDLEDMKNRLGEEYVLVLRMHYLIADSINTEGAEGFVYNLSSYDDIAELYLASDLLITDYSSVFFDYANLRRPILFFTYDIDKYRDTLRGFYFNFEEVAPGPILMESSEVIDTIENINQVEGEYEEKFEAFYERFCSLDNGTASRQIIKRVFNGEK